MPSLRCSRPTTSRTCRAGPRRSTVCATSAGGLVQQRQRLAKILEPWYAIAQEARASAVLNADETGWRVNGKTHWPWCFTTALATCYVIDPKRSSDVLVRVLADCSEGTLVSDFFSSYNVIFSDRQACLAHLLHEIGKSRKNQNRVTHNLYEGGGRQTPPFDFWAPDPAVSAQLDLFGVG